MTPGGENFDFFLAMAGNWVILARNWDILARNWLILARKSSPDLPGREKFS